MVYDENAAERVRRVLSRRRSVVERKMMGGVCFMLDGNMCCGVSGAALMVRVGPDAYERTVREAQVRPLEFAGRRPRGFVCVDPPGYRTDTALTAWVRRGIDFVSALPKKKPGVRKAPSKRPRKERPR